jgi:hypothetical protein
MPNFSRQLCLTISLNPTRIWEISPAGNAPSRKYVVKHLWLLIQYFAVMGMNILHKNVWQVKVHNITNPWKTQCIAWHWVWKIYLPLSQSEHNILFHCRTTKVPRMYVSDRLSHPFKVKLMKRHAVRYVSMSQRNKLLTYHIRCNPKFVGMKGHISCIVKHFSFAPLSF